MSIEAKKIALYREFRLYRDLSEDEKVAFESITAQEINLRSKAESEEFRQAIKANVDEIKEKILEIKGKLDKNLTVSV